MKKILLIVIMFMMFMGVVSASSINGDFKGNPIVKIYSNSTEVKPDDVPALIYNGRTVVPISMLKKLGLSVTWNQSNYSINVELPKMDSSKLELAKEYAYLMDYYTALQRLKDRINVTDSNLIIDINNVGQNYDVDNSVKFSIDSVNDSVNEYQRLYDLKDSVILRASYYGIADSNIEIILQSYKSSVDEYKLCLVNVSGYRTNSNAVTEFNEHEKNGRTYSTTASDLAYKTYVEYYQIMSGFSGDSTTQTYTPQSTPSPTPRPTEKPNPTPTPTPEKNYVSVDTTPNAIESRIDGDFTGWDGETIFKLQNGQIWQQTSYAYTYHYAYAPKVTIYKDGLVYKMIVDGVDGKITVSRLK